MFLTAAPVPLYATEELPPNDLEMPAVSTAPSDLPISAVTGALPDVSAQEESAAGTVDQPIYPAVAALSDAAVASGDCGASLTWTLDDTGTLTVSGKGKMDSFSAKAAPWYSFRASIQSIVVKKGVTSIGSYAFYGCSNATEVSLPSGLSVIETYAFNACYGLTDIKLPSALTQIANYAFSLCNGLESIHIPTSVNSIASYAFLHCDFLSELTVDEDNPYYSAVDGVLMNADQTYLLFYPGGKKNTAYTVPDGVERINSYSFYDATLLESISLPVSLTAINRGAFSQCTQLTQVSYAGTEALWNLLTVATDNDPLLDATFTFGTVSTVSGSCGKTAIYTFDTATGGLTISGSGTISDDPWYKFDKNITSVTIGADIVSGIERYLASGSTQDYPRLQSFSVESGNPVYYSMGGVLFSYDTEGGCLLYYPPAKPDISYIVPEGTVRISSYAFWETAFLQQITIPACVSYISYNAFWDCNALRSITVAEGNETYSSADGVLLEDGMLLHYPGGKTNASYALPNGTPYLLDCHFSSSCPALTELRIPVSVTSINPFAFLKMPNLETIVYEGSALFWETLLSGESLSDYTSASVTFENAGTITGTCGTNLTWTLDDATGTLTVSGNGGLYGYDPWGAPWSAYNDFVRGIVVEEGITSIGQYAFIRCVSATSASIPKSVTFIGPSAFADCDSLPGFTLADGNKDFRVQDGVLLSADGKTLVAFPGGYPDTAYTIPESVTDIGSYAFRLSGKLEEVIIPSTVTTIGEGAFYQCFALTDMTIPNSVTAIHYAAFAACSNLAAVNIPEKVTSISKAAFLSTGITSLVIPDKVTAIGSQAFCGCTDLETVTIPLSVTSIDTQAFYRCSSLEEVSYAGTTSDWGKINILSGNEPLLDAYRSSNPLQGTCGDALTWSLSSKGVLTISGTGSMDDYALYEAPWYPYQSSIRKIIVNSGVTALGDGAFYECGSATTVTLPETLVSIGVHAFANCENLENVSIPASVRSIGNFAFSSTGLISIELPASVTSLGDYLFSGCNALTGIYVAADNPVYYDDDGVLIRRGASTASPVREVNLLASWGDLKLYVPEEPVNAASDVLLVYPFARTAEEYIVPDSIGVFDSTAFRDCPALKTIHLGKNLRLLSSSSIIANPFNQCSALTAVEVDADNPIYFSIDGVLYQRCNDKELALICYPNAKADTAFVIPDGVTSAVFRKPTHLTDVTVPLDVMFLFSNFNHSTTVHYAGSEALWSAVSGYSFRGNVICHGTADQLSGTFGDGFTWTFDGNTKTLTLSGTGDTGDFQPYLIPQSDTLNCPPWQRLQYRHIVIEEGITRVGSFAFNNNHFIESITFPSTLTALGEYLSSSLWSNVSQIEIPAGLTSLSGNTFDLCKDIVLSPDNTAFVLEDDVLFTADRKTLVACYRTDEGAYTVPQGVETIGKYAFYRSKLGEIILPDSLKTVGEYAFYGCENLDTLIFPGNVETIGIGALLKCSIETLFVENSLMRPQAYWFVTELDETKLETLTFSGTITQWPDAGAGFSDYYPEVTVICRTIPEALTFRLDELADTLTLYGTAPDADTVLVAFYAQSGQLKEVLTYCAADLSAGVRIEGISERLQYSIHILQVNGSHVPVADMIPVHEPFSATE